LRGVLRIHIHEQPLSRLVAVFFKLRTTIIGWLQPA